MRPTLPGFLLVLCALLTGARSSASAGAQLGEGGVAPVQSGGDSEEEESMRALLRSRLGSLPRSRAILSRPQADALGWAIGSGSSLAGPSRLSAGSGGVGRPTPRATGSMSGVRGGLGSGFGSMSPSSSWAYAPPPISRYRP